MTAVLSSNGEILLPEQLRTQMRLRPGDDFDVFVDDEDTITLRRSSPLANAGLVDLLLACPAPFEIPERGKDDSAPLVL